MHTVAGLALVQLVLFHNYCPYITLFKDLNSHVWLACVSNALVTLCMYSRIEMHH